MCVRVVIYITQELIVDLFLECLCIPKKKKQKQKHKKKKQKNKKQNKTKQRRLGVGLTSLSGLHTFFVLFLRN